MNDTQPVSRVSSRRQPPGYEDYLWLLKRCLTGALYEESAWSTLGVGENLRDISWRDHALKPRRFLRLLFHEGMQRCARKFSLLIVKTRSLDINCREDGKDCPFIGYSMVGLKRLNNIQMLMERILEENVPGDFIETGVWRGGATILMRAVLKAWGATDRIVWVADSFEGLPKPNVEAYGQYAGQNLSHALILKASLEEVQANFRKFGLLDNQVRFLKGWFCDTLPKAPIERLALLRLDGDLYESTIDALEALYFRVSDGGYVIVDDYYGWPSCRKAVHDFLAKHGIQAALIDIDKDAIYWRVQKQGQAPLAQQKLGQAR